MLRYHLTSAAWVVADTVEAITGMPLKDYHRNRSIARPLGLDLELGVPPDKQVETVAPIVPIGDVPSGWKPDPWGPWFFSDPEKLAAGEPSHTITSTAVDTVLLFQSVYHTELFDPEVVGFATSRLIEMPLSGGSGNVGSITAKGLFVNIGEQPTAFALHVGPWWCAEFVDVA